MSSAYECDIEGCKCIVKISCIKQYGDYIWKICPKHGRYRWRRTAVGGQEMKDMVEKHKWYHVKDLAEMIGRSVAMIRYWVLRGVIPYYNIGGRTMFMDTDIPAIKMFVKLQGRRGPNPKKEKEV